MAGAFVVFLRYAASACGTVRPLYFDRNSPMQTYLFDPIDDARWLALVQSHPDATTFHHPGWMRALKKTYGYRFFGVTTTPPGEPLRDGLPLGMIRSFLTGSRVVSMPFSDHCGPLVTDTTGLVALLSGAHELARAKNCMYAEIRPLKPFAPEVLSAAGAGSNFEAQIHSIDLAPSEEQLFQACSDSSVRRVVRKAQKRLRYEEGTSDSLLNDFYRLMIITRRKHRIPPQSRGWFRNVLDELPGTKVHVAYLDQAPTSAILTACFGGRYMYKYGASDVALMKEGGSPFLLWCAICEARAAGCAVFDMGRTEIGHEGLSTFKERFNAVATPLVYYRMPAPTTKDVRRDKGLVQLAEPIFARLPDALLVAAGRIFYRHMG